MGWRGFLVRIPHRGYTHCMSDVAEKIIDEEQSFTYADYKSWELDEGERYELMGGKAYVMAAPYDVRLLYEKDESDDTVVQPDISVICDEVKGFL
jgi:hypothetical protein